MATNPQQPPAQAPEAEVILVRGSEEYNEYMRHQGGRIKAVVNGIEDFLSVSGRTLLLVFVLYTTVKGGMTVTGHQVPWMIDILMLAFKVCGLEGSIPGLSRFRENMLLKNTQAATDDAETIRKTITSARTLNFLTGVEIMLAAYAAGHNIALSIPGLPVAITIANISEFYGYVLLLARLWFITSFIIEMSRLEVKKPKIISQAEADRLNVEKEQEQIRMDNAAVQANINQALAGWTAAQDQKANEQSIRLSGMVQAQIAEALANFQPVQAGQVPDLQALTQAVANALLPDLQARFSGIDQVLHKQHQALAQAAAQANQALAQAKRVPEQEQASGTQATNLRQFKPRPQMTNAGVQVENIALLIDPTNATREELIEEAKRLQRLGLSTYQIGEKLTKPAKTVQSWLPGKKMTTESGELEAING